MIFRNAGRFVGHNYLAQTSVVLTAGTLGLLAALDRWRTADEIAARTPALAPGLSALLDVLVLARLVDRRLHAREPVDPLASWKRWKPLAAALHFSTRNAVFPNDPEWRAPRRAPAPMPAPCKRYPTALRVPLPPEASLDTLTDSLERRRTWRQFRRGTLALGDLATLLRLTFGVRRWRRGRSGRVVFKTSPSGGARHPVEAYVAARRVQGLPPGLYHFDAARHDLARLRPRLARRDLVRYVAGQDYFGDAAVMIVMTAVWERTQWRYSSPRAYRTVHIELGHLAQSFCLIATALDLAPFTTMAVSEAAIERDLGLDAARESAMYVIGAGLRAETPF